MRAPKLFVDITVFNRIRSDGLWFRMCKRTAQGTTDEFDHGYRQMFEHKILPKIKKACILTHPPCNREGYAG